MLPQRLFSDLTLKQQYFFLTDYGRAPDGNGHAAVGFSTGFVATGFAITGATGATTAAALTTTAAGFAAGLATGLVAAFFAGGVTFLQVQPLLVRPS